MTYPITPKHIEVLSFKEFVSPVGLRHDEFAHFLTVYWILRFSQCWYKQQIIEQAHNDKWFNHADCPVLPEYKPCDLAMNKAVGWPWPTFNKGDLISFITNQTKTNRVLNDSLFLTKQYLGQKLEQLDLAKFSIITTLIKTADDKDLTNNDQVEEISCNYYLNDCGHGYYQPSHKFAARCFLDHPNPNYLL